MHPAVVSTLLPVCFAFAATPLAAQRVRFERAFPAGWETRSIRSAGDVDGDGVQDVAAALSTSSASELWLVSGANGTVLQRLTGLGPGALDAVGLGDVDGDGRSDVAVLLPRELRVYSGASGALRFAQSPPSTSSLVRFTAVSACGDQDNDGRADLALVLHDLANDVVSVRTGMTGALLRVVAAQTFGQDVTLLPAGDLDQDGRTDLAIAANDSITLLTTFPGGVRNTIALLPSNEAGRTFGTSDLDGDGKDEILVGRPNQRASTGRTGRVEIYSADTGQLRSALEVPFRGPEFGNGNLGRDAPCGIGDLDRDGIGDVVAGQVAPFLTELYAFSGRTGGLLWTITSAVPQSMFGAPLANLGDVDGDTFDDLAMASYLAPAGGTAVLSGRVLADVLDVGGACGQGPFLPQLGATRPVLGGIVTIACRDGTPGAAATLAMSLQPPHPVALGASTCRAAFDLGNWTILHATAQAQWSLQVPLPNVPQFAGLSLALQAFYVPTGGILGFDLSNGLWARLGWQ